MVRTDREGVVGQGRGKCKNNNIGHEVDRHYEESIRNEDNYIRDTTLNYLVSN